MTPTPVLDHRRRRQYGDEHWKQVAAVYAALQMVTRKPTAALADRFGVSVPTASRWVATARGRGLLPATTPGSTRSKQGSTDSHDPKTSQRKEDDHEP
jgi:hypothetical protein